MKIAYITGGAAGMYCGTCLHDNTLAAKLIRMGHDVALIPTYTPIRTDETDVSIDRVFYGAINVYLEQKSFLFRHTPWLVDRMLTRPALLNWAAGQAGSTDARDLGEITLSVLLGEKGNQRKELMRLVTWLRDDFKPDIVHLSNSMFSGLARTMRLALGVPVLGAVSGEDLFLDELQEPYRERVIETLRERAADVDAFIAPSRYYLDYMSRFLALPPARMHHVPLGISLEGHGGPAPTRDERPYVIGYLARLCPEKGLHLLVEAFRRLAERHGRDQVRLRIAGTLAPRDKAYFGGIMDQIRAWRLEDSVDHLGEVDRESKIEFLRSLHVLSVPTTYVEPKGLFVLEALANGIPVVQPRHGAFPELLEKTGGGLLVDADSAEALATGLAELMDDPGRRGELGRRGQEIVQRDHTDDAMAERTLAIYRSYIERDPQDA